MGCAKSVAVVRPLDFEEIKETTLKMIEAENEIVTILFPVTERGGKRKSTVITSFASPRRS